MAFGEFGEAPAAPGAPAQAVIENPAKPPAPNAGRVVTVKEEMRIADTGEGFYIKTVNGIRVAEDGAIFIKDRQDQALQFDPKGKFIRNLMKKGQGPGEMNMIFDLLPAEGRVLLAGMPPKIVAFDYEGRYLEEIGLQAAVPGVARFVAAAPDAYYVIRTGRPDPAAGSGWQNIPEEILAVPRGAKDAKDARVTASFPIPANIQVFEGRGVSSVMYNSLLSAPHEGLTFFLAATPEYLVKVCDIGTGRIVREFRRAYDRIRYKRPEKRPEAKVATGFKMPEPPEFYADISALHAVGGKLWVQTSTTDPKKGILFDVFEPDGRYVDNFFLKFTGDDPDLNQIFKTFTFAGGFVYFTETTADDLVVVKKCSLVGL